MKILVPLHVFVSWNGGVDLIRVIVTALRAATAEQKVELAFALPRANFAPGTSLYALRQMARELCAGQPIFECDDNASGVSFAAIESKADIVFPSFLPIRTSLVKKVGYVYDFQHRDLPQNFTPKERAERDQAFADVARRSDAMFVTSRSVAAAVHRVLGVAHERILVMPFTPYVKSEWFDTDIAAAQNKYRSGERYAVICNHFWMHKDHATALRALKQVVEDPRHADLQLVMTGDTSDFRDESYFGRLTTLIATLGITDRCRIVGLIPKADQIALLRGAEMLLQPTLYEGGPGGGASYEATGLGIPAILSDIAVNREVVGDTVRFFKTGDADDLAAQMLAVLDAPRTRSDEATLVQHAQQNLRHTGDTLIACLNRIAG